MKYLACTNENFMCDFGKIIHFTFLQGAQRRNVFLSKIIFCFQIFK